MGPKKTIAYKRHRGSSSSNFDPKRFVSVDADARFHDSMTRRSGLKEWSFDIDIESPRVEYFRQIIESRGWQELYKDPKATAMTVVCEFYANTWDSTPTPMVFSGKNKLVMMWWSSIHCCNFSITHMGLMR